MLRLAARAVSQRSRAAVFLLAVAVVIMLERAVVLPIWDGWTSAATYYAADVNLYGASRLWYVGIMAQQSLCFIPVIALALVPLLVGWWLSRQD